MKRLGVVLALLVLSLPVLAYEPGGVDDVAKTVQASMVVTGIIAVNPDGSVYGYSLDHRDELPAEVVKLIGNTLPQWEFNPVDVDGKPARARARMSLRIVAQQAQPKHWAASIKGAQFAKDVAGSNGMCPPGACLSYDHVTLPTYPLRMVEAHSHVAGTVYLMVAVDRDGRVANAAVRQVDLQRTSISSQMDRWRHAFAAATLKVIHQWTFHVPTAGDPPKGGHWVLDIPMEFNAKYDGRMIMADAGYGQWNVYVPGPVHSIPWVKTGTDAVAVYRNADAIPNDSKPFVQDPRFVLLNRSGEGSGTIPATGHASHG